MDLRSLAGAAEVVVRVRVSSTRVRWAGPRRLVTVAECEVTELFRGRSPSAIRVVTPGGQLGDVGQLVPGAATLQVGEEAILFLSRVEQSRDAFSVVGLEQGKLPVLDEGGGPVVLPSVRTALRRGSSGQTLPGAPVSLEEFRAVIQGDL